MGYAKPLSAAALSPLEREDVMKRPALSFIVLLFIALGPLKAATKDQLVEAVWAYGTGNYEEAKRSFEELATRGNPEAQMLLGRMYATGVGVFFVLLFG